MVSSAFRIEELAVRLRQLAGRDPSVLVEFESAQAHRPEDLLGCRELGEQPGEVVGALDAAAQLVGEHRLGGARGTDEQEVLAGDQSGERSLDHLGSLEKTAPEFGSDGPEPAGGRRGRIAGYHRRTG